MAQGLGPMPHIPLTGALVHILRPLGRGSWPEMAHNLVLFFRPRRPEIFRVVLFRPEFRPENCRVGFFRLWAGFQIVAIRRRYR